MKLFYSLYSSFKGIPPVFIDGLIAISIIFLVFWQDVFGGDEAAKYISAIWIFWLKNLVGSVAVTLVGLQSFRSLSYGNHKQDTKSTTTTTQ